MNSPVISVVIPNYNGSACLEACLGSLVRQSCRQFEIIVVDNASTDESVAVVRRIAPDAHVLMLNRNLGFAAAVNRGVEAAHGEWVAVLNNDTELSPGWAGECARAIAAHPEASFFACRILDYRRRDMVYSAGDCFLRIGIGYRRGQEQPDGAGYDQEIAVFSACGCAAVLQKRAFQSARGYDESFFAYMEDVDLGLRLQASGACGYYLPSAEVYHIGGATSGGEFTPLAVRLRTRNALLLLLKSVPCFILMRCAPMILAGQASWFFRAAGRGRFLSYVRGIAGVLPLAPRMLAERSALRPLWRKSGQRLWQAIRQSEKLAAQDFRKREPGQSRFLSWYFRMI